MCVAIRKRHKASSELTETCFPRIIVQHCPLVCKRIGKEYRARQLTHCLEILTVRNISQIAQFAIHIANLRSACHCLSAYKSTQGGPGNHLLSDVQGIFWAYLPQCCSHNAVSKAPTWDPSASVTRMLHTAEFSPSATSRK